MPYRRLPNTSQARLRALKAALEQTQTQDPTNLRVSPKTALELVSFVPIYEQTLQQYVACREKQTEVSKSVTEAGKVARTSFRSLTCVWLEERLSPRRAKCWV